MNILQSLKRFCRNNDKLAMALGVIVLSHIIGFVPTVPPVLNYVLYMFFAFYMMLNSRENNAVVVVLLIYIPLEMLIASPDPLFKSWSRYILYVLMMMCVSPMFQSKKVRNLRITILKIVVIACAFLGVGSFFAYFLDINYMKATIEDMHERVGLFGGLTNHSMILGPVCGIGSVYLLSLAFKTKKMIYWAMVACCLMCGMLAASRSAFVASLAGGIVTIYCLSGTGARFAKVGVIVIVGGALSSPLWGLAMDKIIEKNLGYTTEVSIDSRESKWENRIDEFKSSPLSGIGFSAVNIKNTNDYNKKTGVVEPGSSWLAILSMTGIIGFLLILSIFFLSFMSAWRRRNEEWAAILCGLLVLMFVHMIAEGYVFAAGGFLCFTLWLFVGCAYDQRYKNSGTK